MTAGRARAYLDNVPEDEPVFILRAQDNLAGGILFFWCVAAQEEGVPRKKIEGALEVMDAFETWQAQHPPKLPD